jgi:hypothetical protein
MIQFFKTQTIFCLFVSALFCACKNEKPVAVPEKSVEAPSIGLEKSWNMSIASASNLPENGGTATERRMYEGFYKEKSRLGFSWHFFPDGTLVEVSAQKYAEGKWSSNDGNKTLDITVPSAAKAEKIAVTYMGTDSLAIQIGTGKNVHTFGFQNNGAKYDVPTQNPFHPINNQWRIKPTASETDEQLKARIKNNIEHFALILESTIKHNLKTASFRQSPTCYHQYNGGVGLEAKKDLSAAWLDCFFDKNDAERAYKLAEKGMKAEGKAATNIKNNWVQNNLAVFRHLQQNL